MKVGLATTYDTLCGLAIFIRHYIEAAKNDVDFHVLAEKDMPNVPNISILPGIPYTKCWSRKEDYVYDMIKVLKEENCDILHINHEAGLFGNDLRMANLTYECEKIGVKTVLHLNNPLTGNATFYKLLRGDQYIFMNFPEEHLVWTRLGIPAEKFNYIPLACVPYERTSKLDARDELGIEQDRIVLLNTGFVRAATGVVELVHITKGLSQLYPNIQLIIAGGTHPFDTYEHIRRGMSLVKQYNLEKNVTFTEQVHSEEDLKDYGFASDIYVQYRKHYPYPIIAGSIFRAISSRTPMVGYDCPSLVAIRQGILKTLSIKGMTQNIADLIDNPDMYSTLQGEVEELYDRWNWNTVYPKYIDVYRKALE
jgi:glycosyltransferase involved in cell wall biosynthesis